MKYLTLTKEQLNAIVEIYKNDSIGINDKVEICTKTLDNGDTIGLYAEKDKIANYINIKVYWANVKNKEQNPYY